MRDLGTANLFVAGSLGEPGSRTFYLEVHAGSVEWFLVEKQQVAALAERSLELAKEHDVSPDGSVRRIESDPEPTFRVGEMGMGLLEGEVAVVVHSVEEEDEPVTFRVSLVELASMAVSALADVASGRLPCPLCSLPLDPGGHVCPTSNGDLRTSR